MINLFHLATNKVKLTSTDGSHITKRKVSIHLKKKKKKKKKSSTLIKERLIFIHNLKKGKTLKNPFNKRKVWN